MKHAPSIMRRVTADWERMWSDLCDLTPIEGEFRARSIMLHAGGWSKDAVQCFLDRACTIPEPGHRLERGAVIGDYHWVFPKA